MTTTLPRRLSKKLVPLLLSLAFGQAGAVEVLIVGNSGASGNGGGWQGQSGSAGESAVAMDGSTSRSEAILQLAVYGGNGGNGGAGGGRDIDQGVFAGNGGNGGHGAATSGTASSSVTGIDVALKTLVYGGHGGAGGSAGGVGDPDERGWYSSPYSPEFGMGGIGGDGAAAIGRASASTTGAGNVVVEATGRGGNGGGVEGQAGLGGLGGAASASAFGRSDTGRVSVTAQAQGGDGGYGDTRRRAGGGSGGNAELIDSVSGRTKGELVLIQRAVGGSAGSGAFAYDGQGNVLNARATVAGEGTSRLTVIDGEASGITARVSASGGWGTDADTIRRGSPTGGSGHASLNLTSTRAGALLDGEVRADGGSGGGAFTTHSGGGGAADAVAMLIGLGDVIGAATAVGGMGGSAREGGPLGGGGGGSASALLRMSGSGLVAGDARAYGGEPGRGSNYWGTPLQGKAYATLELVGAGARGTAASTGAGGSSSVDATTSGAAAVDVAAHAYETSGWEGNRASVQVRSGVGAVVAGAASVKAGAYAGSSNSRQAPVAASIDVRASGDIDGVSEARSGGVAGDWWSGPATSGAASADATGIASGAHGVRLRASAQAGDVGFVEFTSIITGAARANAYGQSGGGSVEVVADARAGGGARVHQFDRYGHAAASATAINVAAGGRAAARASAWGGSAEVLASAGGVGRYGAPLRVSAGAATVAYNDWTREAGRSASGSAAATNYFDADAFQVGGQDGQAGGTWMASNVGVAPGLAGDVPGAGANVAGKITAPLGVGMQAFGTDETAPFEGPSEWTPRVPGRLTASGNFAFDGVSGQHLLIGFVSASFTSGFDSLELLIANNGVTLFSRLFMSVDEAALFFTDHVLDLGMFGAGPQDVRVSSVYAHVDPGSFGFNYVVGAGAGLAPVPEASSWLMLVLGLGTLALVARRRATTA